MAGVDPQDILEAVQRLIGEVGSLRNEMSSLRNEMRARFVALERVVLRGIPHACFSPPRIPNHSPGKPTVLNWTEGTLTLGAWCNTVGFVTVLHCLSARHTGNNTFLQFGALSKSSVQHCDFFHMCMSNCTIFVFGQDANNEVVFIVPTDVNAAQLVAAFGTPFPLDSSETADCGDCFSGLSYHGNVGGTIERVIAPAEGYWMTGSAFLGTSGTLCIKDGNVIGLIHGLAEPGRPYVNPRHLITRWWSKPETVRIIKVVNECISLGDGFFLLQVTPLLRSMAMGENRDHGRLTFGGV